ncbi:hypothetical protein BGZ94_008057 [Podila epigama]|nr:hypothetical protein BGZ94_008057 [Podila epigama]
MLGSDSASSDLSEASSLTSDNSSGSDIDIKGKKLPRHPKKRSQPLTTKLQHEQQPNHDRHHYPTTPTSTTLNASAHSHPHSSAASHFLSSISSGSESDSDSNSFATDSGDGGLGKRPSKPLQASRRYTSKSMRAAGDSSSNDKKTRKRFQRQQQGLSNAPISLSDSQPVYSQKVLDAAMMLLPGSSKFMTGSSGSSTSGRGRVKSRQKVPLAVGRTKYNSLNTVVVDFNDQTSRDSVAIAPGHTSEEFSSAQQLQHHHTPTAKATVTLPPTTTHPLYTALDASTPFSASSTPEAAATTTTTTTTLESTHSVAAQSTFGQPPSKNSTAERAKPGSRSGRSTNGTPGKQKAGSRKVGRPPKSVSKDVYCICRGPYDGVEFMIACDRCEEWFHGRCIGMKPQDAKKSNNYYCENCQKIRRMLGIASPEDWPNGPSKSRAQEKKSTGKLRSSPSKDTSAATSTSVKIQKTKAKANQVAAESIPKYGAPATTDTTHQHQHQHLQPSLPYSVLYSPSGPWLDQGATVSTTKSPKPQSTKTARRKSIAEPKFSTGSSALISHGLQINVAQTQTIRPAPPATVTRPMPAFVMGDDDDEDVCPVCDFECTCNVTETVPTVISQVSSPCPVEDDSHVYVSEKVPFQPDVALEDMEGSITAYSSNTHLVEQIVSMPYTLNQGSNPLNSDSETCMDEVIDDIDQDDNESQDGHLLDESEAFYKSYKNPMVTPTSHRRPSATSMPMVPRRSGKGIGKAPFLMHLNTSTNEAIRSRGKSLKSGKASRHIYQHVMDTSESEMSDDMTDHEQGSDSRHTTEHSITRHTQHRRDSEYASSASEPFSLNSDGSLSDNAADQAQGSASPWLVPASALQQDSRQHESSEKIYDHSKVGTDLQSLCSTAQTNTLVVSEQPSGDLISKGGEEQPKPSIFLKKRGPGRPKKQRIPLVVSREDEIALYTPAATSRKVASMSHQKRSFTKVSSGPGTRIRPADFPMIELDSDVAEDVMAINAERTDDENGIPLAEGATGSTIVSEGDIFGDGSLSDELSGDLSDIPSEDLDDLSDDALLDFIGSEDHEGDTSSSSPREFHYSEMEEEDESLVDSDSSINSVSTDDSESSDTDTYTDLEVDRLPHGVSDENENPSTFEQEDMNELIDEEEILRMEDEERRLLARAHSLHDDTSEEESDPSKNPFDSSSDEDSEDGQEDDRVFDADGEEYSDEYFEDDYDDIFDGMDEDAILAQLKGIQVDMQALMMIPPEQQEQLLLLQHYAELHQQQQERQQREQQTLQLEAQVELPEVIQQQQQHSQQQDGLLLRQENQNCQLSGLLSETNMLPFDINVPDLDAVSRQLAESIANGMPSSMSDSMAHSTKGLTAEESLELLNAVEAIEPSADAQRSTLGYASPFSTSSITPSSSSALAWAIPTSVSPQSVNSNSNSIPTPANTPTPPGTMTSVSPSIPQVTAVSSGSTQSQSTSLETAAGEEAISTISPILRRGSRLQVNSRNEVSQALPNSPSYKSLSSVITLPSSRSGSVSIPKVSDENPLAADGRSMAQQLSLLNEASEMFKEAAQRAFSGSSEGIIGHKQKREDSKGPVAESVCNTSEDCTPLLLPSETRKRKGGEKVEQETLTVSPDKKRRISITHTLPETENDIEIHDQTSQSISIVSTAYLASTPMPLLSAPSEQLASRAMSPTSAATSKNVSGPTLLSGEAGSNSSNVITSAMVTTETLDPIGSSKANIPFIDPAANIGHSLRQPVSSTQSSHSRRRSSVRSKDLRQQKLQEHQLAADAIVALPMDDLLDTSALYGRSSSRSPSPDRHQGVASDRQEASQTLKDLDRWERVPIGTFRRSRRPSSPHVGLQGALKSGNSHANMPPTLLADAYDHLKHQKQQRHKEPQQNKQHQLSRSRQIGLRKHQSSSSVTNLLGFGTENGHKVMSASAVLAHRKQIVALAQRLGRQVAEGTTQVSSGAKLMQTPPSVHAGMVMEDLSGFGSLGGNGQSSSRISFGSKSLYQRSQSQQESESPSQNLHETESSRRQRRQCTDGDVLSRPTSRQRRMVVPRSASPRGQTPERYSNVRQTTQPTRSIGIGIGIGIGFGDTSGSQAGRVGGSFSENRIGGGDGTIDSSGRVGGSSGLDDLMTDTTQLPSSACPTPLHSPLFSATDPERRSDSSLHEDDGKDIVGTTARIPQHEALVSHFELDISKEMDEYTSGRSVRKDSTP